MLGHLKAEEFVNLVEGGELVASRRSHLNACERCGATWKSMQAMHAGMSSLDADLAEPDWADFRAGVRDQLLSRSVKRESVVRRWTGWAVRPATAWALSIVFAVGVTTITVMWRADSPQPTAEKRIDVPAGTPADLIDAGPEKSLFDDVFALGEEQQEELRQMLESEQTRSASRQ